MGLAAHDVACRVDAVAEGEPGAWCRRAVLAVVVLGLTLNRHKSAIDPGSLEHIHAFYENIVFFLNTLIFAILVASINIAGGFLVTQRMLQMFRKEGN